MQVDRSGYCVFRKCFIRGVDKSVERGLFFFLWDSMSAIASRAHLSKTGVIELDRREDRLEIIHECRSSVLVGAVGIMRSKVDRVFVEE